MGCVKNYETMSLKLWLEYCRLFSGYGEHYYESFLMAQRHVTLKD